MSIATERARGCLVGLAVGDALGAPVEGVFRDRILRHNGQVRDYVNAQATWLGRQGRAHLAGLYTDDTQQALLIADVLVEERGFDPEAARHKYVALAQPTAVLPRGAHRAMAGNFRAALQRMVAGYPPLQTGVPSAGNGAAMRVAPIGLWYAKDPAELRRAAIQASLQTHADIRGIGAAVAVAFLAGHLAAGRVEGPEGERAAVEAAAAFTQEAEELLASDLAPDTPSSSPQAPRFSAALALIAPLWQAPRWDVLRTIVIEANRQQPAQPVTSPGDPFACASAVTAIYLALAAPSFEEAVLRAVNLGGDCDTLGAITGALAGARWGVSAIPQRWVDGLVNLDGVVARADALAGGAKGKAGREDLLAMERRLNQAALRVREGW